jgi:hypothetical protein
MWRLADASRGRRTLTESERLKLAMVLGVSIRSVPAAGPRRAKRVPVQIAQDAPAPAAALKETGGAQ